MIIICKIGINSLSGILKIIFGQQQHQQQQQQKQHKHCRLLNWFLLNRLKPNGQLSWCVKNPVTLQPQSIAHFIVFTDLSHTRNWLFHWKITKSGRFFFLLFIVMALAREFKKKTEVKKMNWCFIPRTVVIYLNEPIISALHLSWGLEGCKVHVNNQEFSSGYCVFGQH